MRLRIEADTLIAQGIFRTHEIAAVDLTHVALMADLDGLSLPTLLARLQRRKPFLRYAILATHSGGLTIAVEDSGFAEALSWLEGWGWNIEKAWPRSLKRPFCREWVERTG